MIRIEDIVAGDGRVGRRFRRRIELPSRELERAVHFYALAFGLGPVDGALPGAGGCIVLKTTLDADLVLRPVDDRPRGAPRTAGRWCFLVGDLDAARQKVWDLGIRVAHDDGAPDQIYRRANGRSLFVCDPDGNELELRERSRRIRMAGPAAHRNVAVMRIPASG